MPLEGGGLVSLPGRDEPLLFTDPASLSFEDLDVTHGAASPRRCSCGSPTRAAAPGTWQVSSTRRRRPPAPRSTCPGSVSVPPGGELDLPVVASAAADAARGRRTTASSSSGRATTTRRVPYYFLVEQAGARRRAPVLPLKTGVKRRHARRHEPCLARTASRPRRSGTHPTRRPMTRDRRRDRLRDRARRPGRERRRLGRERVRRRADRPVLPRRAGRERRPGLRGHAGRRQRPDYDYLQPIQAAGASFPRQCSASTSPSTPGATASPARGLGGSYVLRAWVNDVTPPPCGSLTTHVSTGRPTLVVRTLDSQSGVDPLSLTIGLQGPPRRRLRATTRSRASPLFALPSTRRRSPPGDLQLTIASSDFQEAKNVDTSGTSIMPNTRTVSTRLHVSHGPTVSWLTPAAGVCAAKPQPLLVETARPRPSPACGSCSTAAGSRPAARAATAPGRRAGRRAARPRASTCSARSCTDKRGAHGHGDHPRAEVQMSGRPRRRRHGRLVRHRRRARARARRPRLRCVLLARREDRLRRARRGDRRRGGAVRRRPTASAVDAVAARVLERHPALHAARQQRRHPGARGLRRRRAGARSRT